MLNETLVIWGGERRLTRLIYRFQGRDYRLTDVAGRVVEPILG
jgi:hypothetical protein